MPSFDDTLQQLVELNDLLKLLVGELQSLLSEPLDDGDGVALLLPVVNQMVENLRMQYALTERQGYLDVVLERYPSWYPHVQNLLDEQQRLQKQLEDVRDRLVRSRRTGGDTERQLTAWLHTFDAHRRRENILVQDAYTLDVGVGE